MKFDIVGRINNMRLPDGKAAILYSVYEAVSNSVHAIEDRFGAKDSASKGEISVDVLTDEDGYIESIEITDNGVGFTPRNLEAFDTCDSRLKEARGGKGIGRLIWLKTFEKIHICSKFENDGAEHTIQFDFVPQSDRSIQNRLDDEPIPFGFGSKILLSDIREKQKEKVRKISFLRDLALHFFAYFMSGTMPRMTVIQNGSSEDLGDFIKDKIETPEETTICVELNGESHSLQMSHMYVDSTISRVRTH